MRILNTDPNYIEYAKRRFWKNVDVKGADDCWPWTGLRKKEGYGRFSYKGKPLGANRVVFFFTHGEWPVFACHSCDNPPCCNPAHIYNGTQAENMRDAAIRGRMPCGLRHHNAKLTEDTVRTLRAEYAAGGISTAKLGRKYGVTQSNIVRVIHREVWAHIP